MNQQITVENFQNIIERLTPESQIYLLNMANMAKVAEQGKEKQIIDKQTTQPRKPPEKIA